MNDQEYFYKFQDYLKSLKLDFYSILSKEHPVGVVGYFGNSELYFNSHSDFVLAKQLWNEFKFENKLDIIDLKEKIMIE